MITSTRLWHIGTAAVLVGVISSQQLRCVWLKPFMSNVPPGLTVSGVSSDKQLLMAPPKLLSRSKLSSHAKSVRFYLFVTGSSVASAVPALLVPDPGT
jgi:hypothetical protein